MINQPAFSFKGKQSDNVVLSRHHRVDFLSRESPGVGLYDPHGAISKTKKNSPSPGIGT